MRASQRHRTIVRAARAWRVGRPHLAWEILEEAGLGKLYPAFVRECQRQARERYLRRIMNEYGAA